MWKIVRNGERSLSKLVRNFPRAKRTFLSEAYKCEDAWNRRLDSKLLSKINVQQMFHELEQKFQSAGKASAVDVDIYANVLRDGEQSDDLLDILHKLRLTTETTSTLDSTHHAVIRFLLDNDKIDDLLTILHDRINYGIFPDHLCYNILMDTFLKRGDVGSAAKVACLLMLQEDNSHDISSILAVYACWKYLEKPETWTPPEPEPPEDPKAEVIKVRVRYLRNPWFDDHFDLVDPSDLVGKTLVFFGKSLDGALGGSCLLRGLVLWKKYREAADLLGKWIEEGKKDCIYAEILPAVRALISEIPEDKSSEETKELARLLDVFNEDNADKGSLLENVEKRVQEAVKNGEEADISAAQQAYEEWEKKRMSVLQAQLEEYDKKARLEKVDEMKEELQKQERLVTYFENKEKIQLQIYEKIGFERKNPKYKPRKGKKLDADENYVPPEIVRKRNK